MFTLRFEQLNELKNYMNNGVDALSAGFDFVHKTEPRFCYVHNQT